jgi:hypothetical protein
MGVSINGGFSSATFDVLFFHEVLSTKIGQQMVVSRDFMRISPKKGMNPLVMTNIAIENHHSINR